MAGLAGTWRITPLEAVPNGSPVVVLMLTLPEEVTYQVRSEAVVCPLETNPVSAKGSGLMLKPAGVWMRATEPVARAPWIAIR